MRCAAARAGWAGRTSCGSSCRCALFRALRAQVHRVDALRREARSLAAAGPIAPVAGLGAALALGLAEVPRPPLRRPWTRRRLPSRAGTPAPARPSTATLQHRNASRPEPVACLQSVRSQHEACRRRTRTRSSAPRHRPAPPRVPSGGLWTTRRPGPPEFILLPGRPCLPPSSLRSFPHGPPPSPVTFFTPPRVTNLAGERSRWRRRCWRRCARRWSRSRRVQPGGEACASSSARRPASPLPRRLAAHRCAPSSAREEATLVDEPPRSWRAFVLS